MTHVEFLHFEVARFADRAREMLSRGEDPFVLLKEPDHSGFGEARLRQVLTWVKEGFPNNSINEGLAVEDEIASLKGMGYVDAVLNGSVSHSRRYAGRHRLNDLIAVAGQRELTAPERKLLGQALTDQGSAFGALVAHGLRAGCTVFRYQWHTDATGTTRQFAVRTGVLLSPAAVMVGAMFHEELGKLILWMSDGSIVEFGNGDDDEKKRKK